jgi:hypothetical protein
LTFNYVNFLCAVDSLTPINKRKYKRKKNNFDSFLPTILSFPLLLCLSLSWFSLSLSWFFFILIFLYSLYNQEREKHIIKKERIVKKKWSNFVVIIDFCHFKKEKENERCMFDGLVSIYMGTWVTCEIEFFLANGLVIRNSNPYLCI